MTDSGSGCRPESLKPGEIKRRPAGWLLERLFFLFSAIHLFFFFSTPGSSAPTPRRVRSTGFYKIAIQEESAVFN